MSIINETWDDGRSYRVKQKDGSWKKKSFLHKAKDLLFGDGSDLANNAENNLGAIKGLTKSTNVTEEGYAVDATVINQINSKLSELFHTELETVHPSIAAGFNEITIPITTVEGYTPIGIVGCSIYIKNTIEQCSITRFQLTSDTKALVSLYSSSERTDGKAMVAAAILYVKNG